MKFIGVLTKEIISVDSKSEREALVLKTKIGTFTVRRFGSNAMQMDEELLDYVDKTLILEGMQHGSIIIFKDFEEK